MNHSASFKKSLQMTVKNMAAVLKKNWVFSQQKEKKVDVGKTHFRAMV